MYPCCHSVQTECSPVYSQPYGSFHQLYRLDDELIAIGVLDILPNAVSGVYFIYDPKWSALSLGKLSALRECTLAAELADAGYGETYYMMGERRARNLSLVVLTWCRLLHSQLPKDAI